MERTEQLKLLQEHYADFRNFLADMMEEHLGHTPTALQYSIAHYMAKPEEHSNVQDPRSIMVQAARGEGKTMIAGCFAVWRIIHNPRIRVVIVSASNKFAKEVSGWVLQIINNTDKLSCLIPNKSHPDTKMSVEAYTVHHELRGVQAAPTIKCLSITSQLQGSRADLLISDDVESMENSLTEMMREKLKNRTSEYSDVCSGGMILWLGTPQSRESVYADLPEIGFTVKIWPARIPTEKQREFYGPLLADYVANLYDKYHELRTGYGPDGQDGAPSDPDHPFLCESELIRKLHKKRLPAFTLQYMLNTHLSDEERYPLKIRNLLFYPLNSDSVPGTFTWTNSDEFQVKLPAESSLITERFLKPSYVSKELFEYTKRIISLDPSGGGANGDETGYSVLFTCNGYIFCMEQGGIKGGTEEPQLEEITRIMKKWDIKKALVEKNYGHGMYANALRATWRKLEYKAEVIDAWASGQKELRIIDSLEPVIGLHKLIFNISCIREDIDSTKHYEPHLQTSYQMFKQIRSITRDRGSLKHDDRVDALAQGVDYLQNSIKQDAKAAEAKKKQEKLMEFIQNPNGLFARANAIHNLSNTAPINRNKQLRNVGMLSRFKRKNNV